MARFAFNSSVCSSTGFSPFEVAYGRRPAFPGDARGERSDVPRAEAAAVRIIASTTACRDHFELSQLHNQESVHRRNDGPVRTGDLVLLSTKGQPRQMAVYLLDLSLVDKPDDHEFATCTLPVKAPKYTAALKNWSFMRALKHSFPEVTYLKDLLPGDEASVVFQNTLLPIHTVVASRLTGGGKRELLVQFSESNYENSAWVREKFVPRPYLDDFLQRVDPDEPPAAAHN